MSRVSTSGTVQWWAVVCALLGTAAVASAASSDSVDAAAFLSGTGSGLSLTVVDGWDWKMDAYSDWDSATESVVSHPYLSGRPAASAAGEVEIVKAAVSGAGVLKVSTALSGPKSLLVRADGVAQTNAVDKGYGKDYAGGYYGAPRDYACPFWTSGAHTLTIVLTNAADVGSYSTVSVGPLSWTPAPTSFEVVFDGNGGEVSETVRTRVFSPGDTYGELPAPTRSNGDFVGWFTDRVGGRAVSADDPADWQVPTLYARWTSTVADALDEGLTDVRIGRDDISADGNGVLFALSSGYPDTKEDNFVEATCSGEAILSFDCVLEGPDLADEAGNWHAFATFYITLDGEPVPVALFGNDRESVSLDVYSSRGETSQRQAVRIFVAPGTHVLRWSVPESYSYDRVRMRLAIENVRVESPIANRETLFDWGRLAYDARIWNPDNLSEIQSNYTARIATNAQDYEAYIWRALTKIVRLGENEKVRAAIARCGFALDAYTCRARGEFVGFADPSSVNGLVDDVAPEALAALDSALADLKAIPENWAGRITLDPSDYGFTLSANAPFQEDDKICIGLAEVSLARAALELSRAAVNLACGYDYAADYLAVSNAVSDVEERRSTQLHTVLAVAPNLGAIRSLEPLLAAKADFRAALASVKRADNAVMSRGDDAYLVEYDLADKAEIEAWRTLVNQVEASLDQTNTVDVAALAERHDTDGSLRAKLPGGRFAQRLFLGALFAGQVTSKTVPDLSLHPLAIDTEAVGDVSFGGLFPDLVATDLTNVVQTVITNASAEIDVPMSWLEELAAKQATTADADAYQAAFAAKFGDDFRAAIRKPTGKRDALGQPLYVWQDYVAGTDPLDENDTFTATLTVENGVPVVKWSPELSAEATARRKYTVYGAKALDAEWTDVSLKEDAERQDMGYRFFRVSVEMR